MRQSPGIWIALAAMTSVCVLSARAFVIPPPTNSLAHARVHIPPVAIDPALLSDDASVRVEFKSLNTGTVDALPDETVQYFATIEIQVTTLGPGGSPENPIINFRTVPLTSSEKSVISLGRFEKNQIVSLADSFVISKRKIKSLAKTVLEPGEVLTGLNPRIYVTFSAKITSPKSSNREEKLGSACSRIDFLPFTTAQFGGKLLFIEDTSEHRRIHNLDLAGTGSSDILDDAQATDAQLLGWISMVPAPAKK